MDTQTLIDKQLIRELQNHYSYSIDSGEYDNLDNVFLPNVIAEPLRLYRRLQLLRGLEHEYTKTIFPRGQGTGSSNGIRA